ncbi:hypothetical protein B0J12DRAFT_661354, partial [Macrophomina phaseolina]
MGDLRTSSFIFFLSPFSFFGVVPGFVQVLHLFLLRGRTCSGAVGVSGTHSWVFFFFFWHRWLYARH